MLSFPNCCQLVFTPAQTLWIHTRGSQMKFWVDSKGHYVLGNICMAQYVQGCWSSVQSHLTKPELPELTQQFSSVQFLFGQPVGSVLGSGFFKTLRTEFKLIWTKLSVHILKFFYVKTGWDLSKTSCFAISASCFGQSFNISSIYDYLLTQNWSHHHKQ